MSSLLVILIGTVLVNTFLLMQNDEALGGTRHAGSIASAIRIGGGTSIVLLLSSSAATLIWNLIRFAPQDALLFIFSLIVVALAVSLDRIARQRLPLLNRALTTSPILIVSNSIALGTGMLASMISGMVETLTVACVLAAAFVGALSLFVAMTSRIASREVPSTFRSAPITLVSAGLLTLALMGFTGLFRG